jgi:DNA polymerase III delta subunit
MLFIYLITEELNLALKLVGLSKLGEIKENISYNEFKSSNYEKIKKNFKTNRGYIREYPIFLKLKYISLFNEEYLIKMISKLLKVEYSIKTGGIEEGIGIERFIIEFKKG